MPADRPARPDRPRAACRTSRRPANGLAIRRTGRLALVRERLHRCRPLGLEAVLQWRTGRGGET